MRFRLYTLFLAISAICAVLAAVRICGWANVLMVLLHPVMLFLYAALAMERRIVAKERSAKEPPRK